MANVYRDDRDAADALATKLRRDNAELEDEKTKLESENARLREELASRPPKQPSKRERKAAERRARAEKERRTASERRADREDKKKRQAEARMRALSKGPAYNWTVRIIVGLCVGVVSFFVTRTLYPIVNRGLTSLWVPVFGALLNQIWGLAFISQAILGWWLNEDAVGGVEKMTRKHRIGMIVGGIVAVLVTAAFGAIVGESSPD